MIRSFRHRGLKQFHNGDPSNIGAELRAKVERVLDFLNAAEEPPAMDLPGYLLHPLMGELRGFWSVTVSGSERIIFRFANGDACDIDLVDYH